MNANPSTAEAVQLTTLEGRDPQKLIRAWTREMVGARTG